MGRMTRAERWDAQRRRTAVRLYRAGVPVTTIAQELKQSTRWVYKWIHYQTRHRWTRFRSASRAPHHHSNQTPEGVERRILRLRQQLVRRLPRACGLLVLGLARFNTSIANSMGPPPARVRFSAS